MIDIAQGSWSKGITPIAHIPMQDRPAFKMAIHQHEDRWYLYCAHFWHSGLTIVEITDPSHPRFIKFIVTKPVHISQYIPRIVFIIGNSIIYHPC